MNAAIRAVVRMGLYAGAKVFTVWEVGKLLSIMFGSMAIIVHVVVSMLDV